MSNTIKNILSTLAYFDMFNYPLTRVEIYMFLPKKHTQQEFDHALAYMVTTRLIYQIGRFYSLKNDYLLMAKRQKGNEKAAELIKKAQNISNLLICFPYVRGVAISGSLSKNYADEKSDIDFFIIAAANRLWIARTLMHCFKKLTFVLNKQHYFCMNYYIDEQQLQITEKNIYTAIEIATLMPLQGDHVFEQFYTANAWTLQYLPNNCMRLSSAKPLQKTWVKTIFEKFMDNRLGNWLDSQLMEITSGRWMAKTRRKKLNLRGVLMSLIATRHCAKPNPVIFQNKLITQYEEKVSQLIHERDNSVAY